MEERRHPWRSFLATFGVSTLIARLAGWSWDKVWRHYLAWIVICYAGILAFDLFAQLFLFVDQDVPPLAALGRLHRHHGCLGRARAPTQPAPAALAREKGGGYARAHHRPVLECSG